jgi:hypothetical protein
MWQRKKFVVLAAISVVLVLYMVLRLRPSPVRDERDARKDLANGQVLGERDAQKDLASGHYIQLGYGLPFPWTSEFDQCLRGYGIELRNIGSDVFVNGHDVATGYEMSYYQSYNAVSSAAIKQKFGPDVFDLCTQTARNKWENSHPESKRKNLP